MHAWHENSFGISKSWWRRVQPVGNVCCSSHRLVAKWYTRFHTMIQPIWNVWLRIVAPFVECYWHSQVINFIDSNWICGSDGWQQPILYDWLKGFSRCFLIETKQTLSSSDGENGIFRLRNIHIACWRWLHKRFHMLEENSDFPFHMRKVLHTRPQTELN